MYATNYFEDKILRTFLGTTANAPATMYAALFLSNPGETGGGTEIAYTGYARQPITFSEPSVNAGSVSIANVSDVAFPSSDITTGNITYLGLMDAVVAGNMWAYVALDEPIQVVAGVSPLIQASEWNYMSSGNLSNAYKAKYLNVLRGVNLPGFSPNIALYNGSPDNGGQELAGSGYARFGVTFGTPAVQPSGQSMITNTVISSSPRSLENWGTFTHIVIMDDSSGGQAVAYKEYGTSMIIGRGKAVYVQAGEYSVSMN
jgi:hypothetical protein